MPRAQRGAALFVALAFLIVLALLGLAAAGNSVMQEKMTGGARNRQLAINGVETAVRGGEIAVWNIASSAEYAKGGDAMPPCRYTVSPNCVWTRQVDDTNASTPGGLAPTVNKFRTSQKWDGTATNGVRTYGTALTALTGNKETASLYSQPLFMVEDLGLDTGGKFGRMAGARLGEQNSALQRHLYRITGRSQGGNSKTAVRVVESVYSAYGTNHQFNP
jgi:type IV pilus assembly protein PilX